MSVLPRLNALIGIPNPIVKRPAAVASRPTAIRTTVIGFSSPTSTRAATTWLPNCGGLPRSSASTRLGIAGANLRLINAVWTPWVRPIDTSVPLRGRPRRPNTAAKSPFGRCPCLRRGLIKGTCAAGCPLHLRSIASQSFRTSRGEVRCRSSCPACRIPMTRSPPTCRRRRWNTTTTSTTRPMSPTATTCSRAPSGRTSRWKRW